MLEPDVELAGYYGFTNSPDTIRFVSGASPGTVHAVAAQMRQRPVPAAAPVPVANLPGGAHDCGTNFAIDVLTPVQGSNDSFALGPSAGASCAPYGAGAVNGADTLTIRRVETVTAAPEADRLQLYASRLRSRSAQQLFVDGNAPGQGIGDGYPDTMQATGKGVGRFSRTLIEFSARMQASKCQHHYRNLFLGMRADRDSPTVIGHRNRAVDV